MHFLSIKILKRDSPQLRTSRWRKATRLNVIWKQTRKLRWFTASFKAFSWFFNGQHVHYYTSEQGRWNIGSQSVPYTGKMWVVVVPLLLKFSWRDLFTWRKRSFDYNSCWIPAVSDSEDLLIYCPVNCLQSYFFAFPLRRLSRCLPKIQCLWLICAMKLSLRLNLFYSACYLYLVC